MAKSGSTKPFIQKGWLRVLLYIPAVLIAFILLISFFVLGFHKDHPDMSGIIDWFSRNKPGLITGFLFISAFLVTFIFRKWIDRKSFVSLGFKLNGYFPEIISGVMLSLFIVGSSGLLMKMTGHLRWMDIIFDPRAIFIAFGTVVLYSVAEELIFRGYILNNLLDSFGKWPALFISAGLFMIVHWETTNLFSLINALIIGLILGLNYVYTRNLWFSISFHIAWKFFEGPLLGFPGSESFQTLLQADFKGDENITGGAIGLEGSYLFTVMTLLSLIALYLFFKNRTSQRSLPVPNRI